jgi:hypothetical protein
LKKIGKFSHFKHELKLNFCVIKFISDSDLYFTVPIRIPQPYSPNKIIRRPSLEDINTAANQSKVEVEKLFEIETYLIDRGLSKFENQKIFSKN